MIASSSPQRLHSGVAARLDHAMWWHPEWTVAILAVASWVVLLVAHARGWPGFREGVTAPNIDHPSMHHRMLVLNQGSTPWLASQAAWFTMAAAMMLPATLPTARSMALNGRWRRRQRAIALFVTAFLAVWIMFGLAVLPISRWIQIQTDTRWALAAALAFAALWELTPTKRRFLRACHRTVPLPPDGWTADAACLRFGLRYGLACLGACWALMLPMAIAGHASLWLMIVLTAIVTGEEVLSRGTELGGIAALTLVAAAAAVVMTA